MVVHQGAGGKQDGIDHRILLPVRVVVDSHKGDGVAEERQEFRCEEAQLSVEFASAASMQPC